MAYVPYNWKDGEEGGTPITAARLNHIETGLSSAATVADNASTLKLGTTADTAKAGNYHPTYAQVTGKPATFPPTIGTTATTAMAGNTALLAIGTTASTAKAGNWNPTIADVTGLQAILDDYETRIAELESA